MTRGRDVSDEQSAPDAAPAAAARGRWAVPLAVGVGAYMSALDNSVVNAILPILTQDLGTDVATVEWVVTVYLLVQSGLLLSFGRLGDMRGHKRVYAAGFVDFVLASVLCGLAPSPAFLVGARGLQAIGASMLIANAPAILTHAFPSSQRGRVLGWQATAVYLGVATGPPLGGWLATLIHWRAPSRAESSSSAAVPLRPTAAPVETVHRTRHGRRSSRSA